jgi:hypothetical protein
MEPALQAECLVALLGAKFALRTKARPITEAEISRAAKLPDVLKRRVGELLDASKASKQAGPPELPDYHEMSDKLVAGADHDVLTEQLVSIPDEALRFQATQVWLRALNYLSSIFPRRSQQDLSGIHLLDPSPGEWAEWGWAWRLANEPLFCLDLMAEGLLIGNEVTHLRAMFPLLFAELCGTIDDIRSDRIAKDKDWQMPWWLQKQICTLLGISPVSPTLLADIEGAVKASQAQTQQRNSALKITNPGSTPSQRVAEK